MSLPGSLPRAGPVSKFRGDPLAYLLAARREHGDVVAAAEGQALLSGARRCEGAVAAFGPEHTRAVLTDAETFGMPVSVSERYAFPPALANLNSGLFSMRGEKHKQRQQLLSSLLGAGVVDEYREQIGAGCDAFLESWAPGKTISLLSEMRRFALHVSGRLIFGSGPEEGPGAPIQRYFQLRRAYSARRGAGGQTARTELFAAGARVDEALREALGRYRREPEPRCLLARLARGAREADLSEDELVAHGNILFMSSSEPVAVALTWTVLVLSQLPELRRRLRQELAGLQGTPGAAELRRLPLVDAVVRESLRVLPPNAIMVRLTTRETQLGGHALPAGCEVLLSPFVSHRDPERFPEPDAFLPRRCEGFRPTGFEYLPFGSGARYCVGRVVAQDTLRVAVATFLSRFDVALAHDQAIDWEVNVNLTPGEPVMELSVPAAGEVSGSAHAGGSFRRLLDIDRGAA